MNKPQTIRARALGDIRAEADGVMLNSAFLETPDYRTLIESSDRVIVVGRRGTGKSAIAYQLGKYWKQQGDSRVLLLDQEEDQVISLRPLLARLGGNFRTIRAAARRLWEFALLLELAETLSHHYRFEKAEGAGLLDEALRAWRRLPSGVSAKLFQTTKQFLSEISDLAGSLGDLPVRLRLREIRSAVVDAMRETKLKCVIIIDRLDEGYEPDPIGVGLLDGLVQAIIDLKTDMELLRPVVFLRDNIFRAVSKMDPDYSRNIEGQVLRLHWDEYLLMSVVANRLRTAFHIDQENSQRVWDRCTARELQGAEGFKRCLRYTLYRPRDLISLLNDAFLSASRHDRTEIVPEDIEESARTASEARLDDLCKEYEAILPGIRQLTRAFARQPPRATQSKVVEALAGVVSADTFDSAVQQSLSIIGTAEDAIIALYGVGFLGIQDAPSGVFVFCHDGRQDGLLVGQDRQLMVHPCYWIALNMSDQAMGREEREAIYDEYDIEVASSAPEMRKSKLGKLIASIELIALGDEGAQEFEEWCLRALRVIFAGALRNFELKPNAGATQRRDIVATNLGERPAWKRVVEDYKSRQVLFEVKNYETPSTDDYRQVLSYLTKEYGNLGYLICRNQNEELQKGGELDCVRELYQGHQKLIIRLTAKFLCKLLSKIRSPGKHDAPDDAMSKLLDQYVRLYLVGQSGRTDRRRRRR